MKQRRQFTPEFQARVVLVVWTGSQSPAAVCRKHALSPHLLATWKATVLQGLASLFQGDGPRDEDPARIAAFEPLLGRATRQIEILKKASTLLDAASTRNGM
jgi:transposase-like protein